MKPLIPVVSIIGLALVIVPPIVYLAGAIDKSSMTSLMLVGTIVWFVTAPFWLGRKADDGSGQQRGGA